MNGLTSIYHDFDDSGCMVCGGPAEQPGCCNKCASEYDESDNKEC